MHILGGNLGGGHCAILTNFNTSFMPPSFEIFLLDVLNSEQKPSVKKRSTGVDFEIYRAGRVEKILTGSMFGSNLRAVSEANSYYYETIQNNISFTKIEDIK